MTDYEGSITSFTWLGWSMGTTYHRVAGLGAGGGRLVLGVGTNPGVGASGIDDEVV